MKKDRVLALALLPLSLSLSSCNASEEEEYALVRGAPDFSSKSASNVLRIGGWVGPPQADCNGKGNEDFITEERYREIADSGINLIYGIDEGGDQDAIKRALDCCEKAGVSYVARDDLVSSFYANASMHEFTKDYDSSPALQGFLITDEPIAEWFHDLGEMKKSFEKEYPGKEFYVNLYPTYATAGQIGTETYEEYLDSYLEQVSPEFLSYDHYCLNGNEENPILTADVLYNLELAQSKSMEKGIPMYTFVRSMGEADSLRGTSEAEISYQVMTELSYGSRAIQYYCYWTAQIYEGLGAYAMIDFEGKKTPVYDAVKNVNRKLLSLDEAYLDFAYQGTLPIQGSDEEDYPIQFTMLDHPLQEIAGIKDIEASEHTLIGKFQNAEGREGYFISNFSDPAYKRYDEISLTFKGADAALVYHGESKENIDLRSSRFSMKLEEGDGVFIIPYKK